MAKTEEEHKMEGEFKFNPDEDEDSAKGSAPGEGWSNGAVEQQMFPQTRKGRISLYSKQRRLIDSKSSWTRIGKGASEHDWRHSESFSGEELGMSEDEEAECVRALIAQLCEKFYNFGWATGTGGGVSIRTHGMDGRWRVFVAPSGIQKEDMIGDDVFELDMERNVVVPPRTPQLRQSACTPLWFMVYKHRPSVKCVIHTHSIHAQMATLLDPTETSKTLKVTHLEMLKGVGGHAYDDVLEIPIIDNRPSEDLLADQLEEAIQNYPKSNAVLVRRHGLYVWGDSWQQAKTQCESFDYLFQSAVQMKSMGLDWEAAPTSGTYRVDNPLVAGRKRNADGGNPSYQSRPPPNKQARVSFVEQEVDKKAHAAPVAAAAAAAAAGTANSTNGFHGMADTDNGADLKLNTIPLLPKDSRILLLDIEGCTTSISFVKDTLFPYVLQHIDAHVTKMTAQEVEATLSDLSHDYQNLPADHPVKKDGDAAAATTRENTDSVKQVIAFVKLLMKHDVKAAGLKKLQGNMWKAGYASGELKGHVYDDFVPLLEWCKSQGVKVYIYSSGSVGAQKLLFGHSIRGDLCHYLEGHFDITTAGNKKESKSYQTIAAQIAGEDPSTVIFVSDAEAELVAAQQAGIGHAVMSVRPGNVPLTSFSKMGEYTKFPMIHSLLQLCGV